MRWSRGKIEIIKWYVYIGLLIVPYIFHPAFFSPSEVPKAIFVCLWLCGLIVIALLTKSENVLAYDSPIGKILWGIAGLALVSSLSNGVLGNAWWGNPYRFDGLLLLFALTGFAYTLGRVWQREWNQQLFALLFLNSVVVQIVGIDLGNPVLLAGYLVVSLPLASSAWALTSNNWQRLTLGSLVVLQALKIWQTGSWGAIAGMGIILILWIGKRLPKTITYSLILAAILGGVYGYSVEMRSIEPGIIVAESRPRILMKALIAIKEKPLLGWGWAQFDRVFQSIDYPTPYLTDAYVDRPHSALLDFGVSMGIPGLVLYLLLTFFTLKKVSAIALTMSLVYLWHSQTNVISVTEELYWWLLVGLALNES